MRSCASSGPRRSKSDSCITRGEVEMGASRGMMVLLVKQVHLQKEVGAVGEVVCQLSLLGRLIELRATVGGGRGE